MIYDNNEYPDILDEEADRALEALANLGNPQYKFANPTFIGGSWMYFEEIDDYVFVE